MKNLLVIDIWHGVDGGASKKTLYEELGKYFNLTFVSYQTPRYVNIINLLRTFTPAIRQWKKKKARLDETISKYPSTFLGMTGNLNKKIRHMDINQQDAIMQIGSLFGPVECPNDLPYFSYSDSTVKNPAASWPDWIPDDFSTFSRQWYELETKYFNRMTKVLTYSDFVKKTLVNHYGIDREKISIVGSALKMTEDVKIDWQNKKNKILFVSTDFKRKGGYFLSEIFARVVSEHSEAQLTIAGNIPDDFAPNNSHLIKCIGAVSKEALKREYATASVLIHPALYDPFPSVILEAANYETPTVASNVCGIPEMIIEGKTGFCVDKDNISGFANHIVRLLKNPDDNKRLGVNAKKRVRTTFHPEIVASKLSEIILKNL